MKKTILLLSLISFIGCSSDNEVQNENITETTNTTNSISSNKDIRDDTDRMFYEYVNSIEYYEFNTALKSFYNKLNIDESKTIDFDIKENGVMEWVEANLHTTNFTNLDSANLEWQQIVNLKKTEQEKFPQVTNFIINNSQQKVLPYIAKWLNPNQIVNNPVDCDQQFNDCNDSADYWFFKNLNDYPKNLFASVGLRYIYDLGNCMEDFNDCIGI